MRIVTLLPSATEIVCELGLGELLVGVTHECDYPTFVQQLPKVTRTLIPHDATSKDIDEQVRTMLKTQRSLYSLDVAVLERLRPDLIVTQALCDVCAVAEDEVQAAACRLPGSPQVINLEPKRLAEVFDSLQQVGNAVDISRHAQDVVARLQARVDRVANRTQTISNRPRVIMLEWIDPPFCAGHWSPELIRIAGGIETLGRESELSRTIAWDEVVRADPEFLLIACCGFNVERTRQDIPILVANPGFNDLTCVRTERVYLVDGSAYFNRPGPRLVDSLEILAHALHPDVHSLPSGLPAAYRLTRAQLTLRKALL